MPFALRMRCYTLGWDSIVYALVHGTFIQLWYFPALIFATLIVVCLYKFIHSLWPVLIATLCLHIWGIMAYTYKVVPSIYALWPQTISLVDDSPNNFLYFGLFYVALGAYIRSRDDKTPINLGKKCIMLSVSIVLWLAEIGCVLRRGERPTICFGLIQVTGIGFSILRNISFERVKSRIFRNMSTVVFGIHYVFYFIYMWYIVPLMAENAEDGTFIFTLGLSVLSAYCIVRLSDKIKALKILF